MPNDDDGDETSRKSPLRKRQDDIKEAGKWTGFSEVCVKLMQFSVSLKRLYPT